MAKPWRSSSMTSIFNTSWANPKLHIWCKFGDSSSTNPLQVIMETSQISKTSKTKCPKWPWRSKSFSIPAESIPGCMFGANLVILAQIYDELLCGQAEIPRILSQNCQNDLEGQGQSPPFSIPAESIPRCMFGANLVIWDQICDELSCGQGKVYRQTDGQTDGQTQATTIPLRSEGPRGKKATVVNKK